MRSAFFVRLAVPAIAFFAYAALASIAAAQATTPQKTEKHEALKQLHHALKLLREADKDYDGHRKAAAEEVHKAIVEIEGKHAKKPAAKPAAAEAKIHEPQMDSDAQMRKALSLLQEVQEELKAKHPKAGTNVSTAIGEINTALKIK